MKLAEWIKELPRKFVNRTLEVPSTMGDRKKNTVVKYAEQIDSLIETDEKGIIFVDKVSVETESDEHKDFILFYNYVCPLIQRLELIRDHERPLNAKENQAYHLYNQVFDEIRKLDFFDEPKLDI